MEAKLVWDTWRRVLMSDRLVEWVKYPNSRTGNPDGLTADETAILSDYADTPAATDSNIGMYRRGLVRNALGALDLLPLTRRLLSASGLDVDKVAAGYVRFTGYPDYGPNFWRNAAGFVAFLAGHPEFRSGAWPDVLGLDAATTTLARRLSEPRATLWPDDAAAAFAAEPPERLDSVRFVVNDATVRVSSAYDLTAWIENPFAFDPSEKTALSPGHWLIYFPAAEATHEYLKLSARAARVLELLSTPTTAAELSPMLDGLALSDVLSMVHSFAELGVVVGVSDLTGQATRGGSVHPHATAHRV